MDLLFSAASLIEAATRARHAVLSSLDVSAILMIAGAVLAIVKPRGQTLASRAARWGGIAINAAALMSSLFVLLEFAFNIDFYAEAILLPGIDRDSGAPAVVAVPLALGFACLSFALLMRFRRVALKRDGADFMALFLAIGAVLFVFVRYESGHAGAIAVESRSLVSAVTLLALAVAVITTRRHGSITRIVASNAITAKVMRPLLIVTVVTPIATDHLTETFVRLGIVTQETGKALDTLVSTLILLGVTVIITRIVARTEFAREEARNKLHESESQLQLQLRSMPIACMTRDTNFLVLSWNPAAEAIFGYTAQEMIGRGVDVLNLPDNRERVDAFRRRLLSGDPTVHTVIENVTRDGRHIVCRWSNTPLISDEGKVVSILSMVEDITTREQAKRQLRQSEERYRMLVEHAPDAVIVHKEGVVRFANPAAAALVGLAAPDAMVGTNVLDFIPDELRPAMSEAMSRMRETKQPARHPDTLLRRVDGEILDAELTAIPIEFEGESVALIMARDISVRKRAERAHKESEQRYRSLVEQAPDGILVRIGERIVFANPTSARLLGCEVESLVGRSIYEVIHPEDLPIARERVRILDDDRLPASTSEYRWQRSDGTVIEVETVGSPMTWAGQPAAQIIFRDVTERNAARRALQLSEERYHRVVDHAPEAIVVHVDGRVLYGNRAAAALINLKDPQEFVGRSILDFVHPDSHVEVTERLRHRKEEPLDVARYSVDLRRWDGKMISTDITAVPMEHDGATVTLLHLRDITEAKRAELALRASEEQYRRVVESMNEGLAILDDQHRTVFANDQFCRIVNQKREDFLGRHARFHWADHSANDLDEHLARRRRGIGEHYETVLTRRSGDDIAISVSASPVMDDGRFVGSVVMINDINDRMKAEDALRDSEERYRELVDHAPDAIVVHSGGKLLFANPATAALIGAADCSEIVGRPILDFIHDDSREQVACRFNERHNADGVSKYETRLQRLDGSPIDADVTAIPIEYGRDNEATLVFVRDVTQRKRAEEQLRESEVRYRDLLDSMPNYIFSVDANNRYIAVNRAVCEAFGRPASEIIGRTPAELGVVAAEVWAAAHERVLRTGEPDSHESTFVLAGGQTIVTRSLLSPLRDDSGAVVGVTGIALDITGQKSAEEAVQRLLHAVEQIDEIIFTTDLEGRITYVNSAFEKIYGYRRDEAIGQTPRMLKSGQQPPEQYEEFWKSILAGRTVRGDYVNATKDGSFVRVTGSATPLFSDGGEITGFVAVQQDITQQRLLEDEQRRLEERLGHFAKMEALGTLAGGVAHDFNNILSIILSHATVIERRAGDAQRTMPAVATIRQAVHRGASLSKQILTFARRSDFKAEPVVIANIASELGSMIRETFPRTIRLSFGADPDLPVINGDAGQIHQALLNLCVNARDAMPAGGTITLNARLVPRDSMRSRFQETSGNDFVCVVVSDNGCGIDTETRQRIFEPFFTTKEKGKGTGLGLALVYGVIKSHHGYIEVDSTPGSGTEFRLYFPSVQKQACGNESRNPVAPPAGTETLLVVDDEEALLAMTATYLRDNGYRVIEAHNGDEALDRCRSTGQIDAVVMDLGMPGMSPTETITALRAMVPDVPVIAMTGYVDPALHASVLAARVGCIIQKPFEPEHLLNTLRDLLAEEAQEENVARR